MRTTIFDVVKVTLLNITTLAISIMQVEAILRILSLVVAVIYTSYKFYREIKSK